MVKQNNYSFEVFSKDGRRLAYANCNKDVVYTKSALEAMLRAGMKLKENGKIIRKV